MKTNLRVISEKILPAPLLRLLNLLIANRQLSRWKKSGRPSPPPQYYKQQAVAQLQRATGIRVLVETGTYLGDMIDAQMKNFEKIYSVELSDALYRKAAGRFRGMPHVTIIHGDSARVLSQIVADLKEPAIFWLDGHYSGDDTASGESPCPLFAELRAIFSVTRQSPVLIDDARLLDGTGGFPHIAELKGFIASNAPEMDVTVEDDIVRCIPRR